MKPFVIATLLFLTTSAPSLAIEPFHLASPNQKFEAIYDPAEEPPFAIADRSTHRFVGTMDDERVGNHGVTATWAPDGKTLVVLVEWRLHVEIHVFRLEDGYFRRTQGPEAPEASLTLDGWSAPGKVRMKGERKAYTLGITERAARFER